MIELLKTIIAACDRVLAGEAASIQGYEFLAPAGKRLVQLNAEFVKRDLEHDVVLLLATDGQTPGAAHTRHVCNCGAWTCGFCGGGLFACDQCGSAEGATTSECPKQRMSSTLLDLVYHGSIDYKDGRWVAGTGAIPYRPLIEV